MGTLGNGLPDLPPEWGEVIIPDDAAELDTDAEQVRRELRHEARQQRRRGFLRRWRRRLHLPDRIDDPESPSLLLPLIVMGAAIVITLMSLLLVAWPSLTRPAQDQIKPSPSMISVS